MNLFKHLLVFTLFIISVRSQMTGCFLSEFRCSTGQCILLNKRCDGNKDCFDGSDEDPVICNPTTSSPGKELPYSTISLWGTTANPIETQFGCIVGQFSCLNGDCIGLDKICDGRSDCSDGSDESASICDNNAKDTTINSIDKDQEQTDPKNLPIDTPKPNYDYESRFFPCELPEQPNHGHWLLHKSLCQDDKNCDPPNGFKTMQPGSRLFFSCDTGYTLTNTHDVFCGPGGEWVNLPKCEKTDCFSGRNVVEQLKCLTCLQNKSKMAIPECDRTMKK